MLEETSRILDDEGAEIGGRGLGRWMRCLCWWWGIVVGGEIGGKEDRLSLPDWGITSPANSDVSRSFPDVSLLTFVQSASSTDEFRKDVMESLKECSALVQLPSCFAHTLVRLLLTRLRAHSPQGRL